MTNIIQFPDLKERSLSDLAIFLEEQISGPFAPNPPLSKESCAEIVAWFVERFRNQEAIQVQAHYKIPADLDPQSPAMAEFIQNVNEEMRRVVTSAARETSNRHLWDFLGRSIELYARIEAAKQAPRPA